MATELPQPGVEIIQSFESAAPTVVTPTLVPCDIAPFFEVIEVLNADGTANDNAQLTDSYEQLELTIAQSSFPSPRGNIDEVDVLEDSIRGFLKFGGQLVEMLRDQAFLTSFLDPEVATQPYVEGTKEEGDTAGWDGSVGAYDVDDRTLILNLDGHTAVPVTNATTPTATDITITFQAADGETHLTLDEVVIQINAILPGVASRTAAGIAGKLKLTSRNFGAGASVVVRSTSTSIDGVDRLGFPAGSIRDDDTIAVGSGFYAIDDSDSDATSPWLKIYGGSSQKQIVDAEAPVISPATFNFVTASIVSGDTFWADGVNIGTVLEVETDQLTMEVEQNLMSNSTRFAPRRVWVQASSLSWPAPLASTAASQKGTIQTAAESVGYIVGASTFVGTIGASESFDINILEDGVALPTATISSGSGWATISDAKTGINAQATTFEAYESNAFGVELTGGGYLALRTLKAGSDQGITMVSISTAGTATAMGWDQTLPVGDIGENIRFKPGTPAILVASAAWTAGAGTTLGQTVIYDVDHLGVAQGTFTLTWAASHAATAPGLAAAIVEWNADATNNPHTQAYEANAAAVETASGGYFAIRTIGENVGTTAEIDKTGGTDTTTLPTSTVTGTDTDLSSANFKWSVDNNPHEYGVTLLADEDDGGVSLQQVINKVNDFTPNVARASSESPPFLEMISQKVGEASEMEILDGTANADLGFSDDTITVGNGRPDPDLAIDIDGNVILQGQFLRDGLTGTPYDPGFAPVAIAYRGLRLDLSPDADNPSLLVIDDTNILEQVADPISTDNPGSLMMFLSLLNAPTISIAGIGVPEISDDAPDGTLIGYNKCFEFLQNEEVYALATASQQVTVHQAGLTHTNAMSEPEEKGERIYFFNPPIPNRASPDLAGSGTDVNTTATPGECTVEVNIAPVLIELGIDPNLDINPTSGAIENELYLDIGTDDKKYLVQKVDNGTKLTLRTSFASGDGNADSFYSTDAFPTTLISDNWSVFLRGAELLIPGTTLPDNTAVAETVQGVGQAYGFRRGYYTFPDQCGINISGLEQVVEGYYATSCIVGMVGQLPPQQGFTNYPITGLTKVIGSNDRFTQTQLNIMAAGGIYILVQDTEGAPVICRHQLSTDLTSIETRELSITKVVDYASKFLRGGLRAFIGRSNITQPFLDQLATVISGQLDFMVEAGVLVGADINNIIQDADAPDTILVDCVLDVPYPCNFIRLVLSI